MPSKTKQTGEQRISFASFTDEDMLTREEVAGLLLLSPRTLAAWAAAGTGPPMIKLGEGSRTHVRYQVLALKAWLAEHTRS
jgi:hypothetical protein